MLKIVINGIVQGVGFRPYVYKLAKSLNLEGYILNSSAGVFIKICGKETELEAFLDRLPRECPPAAVIEQIISEKVADEQFKSFEIRDGLVKNMDLYLSRPGCML